MAKIAYKIIDPELEEAYYKNLKPQDRYTFSRVTVNKGLLSKKRIKGLSQISLLPRITGYWNALDEAEKLAWNNAAAYSQMSGWRLFVQDTAKRIQNGLDDLSTPSIYHQANIGEITIAGTANNIKLVQIHPQHYYVMRKVRGTKSMYESVIIRETFSMPLEIGISYKSELEAAGANPSAKFYANVISSYQGIDRDNLCEIELDLASDWKIESNVIGTLIGHYIGYNIYLELNDVQGTLYFDNIISEHGGSNYARDPRCNNITTGQTPAYFQIPKHWAIIDMPEGANFRSMYPI